MSAHQLAHEVRVHVNNATTLFAVGMQRRARKGVFAKRVQLPELSNDVFIGQHRVFLHEHFHSAADVLLLYETERLADPARVVIWHFMFLVFIAVAVHCIAVDRSR